MLNSAERQKRSAMPVVWSPMSLRGYDNTYRFPIDIITVDKFPKREEHPRLKESVSPAIKKINLPLSGDERMKRIMREVTCCFFVCFGGVRRPDRALLFAL